MCAVGDVPQAYCLIDPAARQALAVGMEGNRGDSPLMPASNARQKDCYRLSPTLQRRTVSSSPPLAKSAPSGLKATALTAPLCP